MVAPWCEQGHSGGPVVPGASLKTAEQTSVMVAPWRRSLRQRLSSYLRQWWHRGEDRGAGAFVEDCQFCIANGGTMLRAGLFGQGRRPLLKSVKQASLMVAPRCEQG